MTLVDRAVRRSPLGVPLVLVLVVAVLSLARPAAAHTRLVATTPASGATVPATTDRLVLAFDQQVRTDLARVEVTGPDGATAAEGAVVGGGTEVVQPLRAPLAPGAWTAAYRVLSADGHPVSGTVTFDVAAAPPPAAPAPTAAPPTTPPAPQPSSEAAGDPEPAREGPQGLAVGLGVVLLGALAGAVTVLRRRGTGR